MAANPVTYSGLSVVRVLSKKRHLPFDAVTWELREARIDDAQGKTVFQQADVHVPSQWSQTALNIVASKYFYGKLGTENREKGVDQLITRVVSTTWNSGEHQGYFASPEAASVFEAEPGNVIQTQASVPECAAIIKASRCSQTPQRGVSLEYLLAGMV